MERHELEHLIRAASAIFGEREWIVVSSQSILGQHPDAPEYFLQSMEADIYARFRPADSDKIEGVLGEESSFHCTFGYYVQGVSPETSVLPWGWESRLTLIAEPNNSQGYKAWCIDIHDMACAKLIANRPKNLEFVLEPFRHSLIEPDVMQERLHDLDLPREGIEILLQKPDRLSREASPSLKIQPKQKP